MDKTAELGLAYGELQLQYGRLLGVLGAVARGEVEPSRVRVDVGSSTWTVLPAAEKSNGRTPLPAEG